MSKKGNKKDWKWLEIGGKEKPQKKKKILALWPHPDDIEISCFGTMCKYLDEWHDVYFLVLSKWEGGSNPGNREKEASESASLLDVELFLENLPDRYISSGQETIMVIEKYVERIQPDVVFLPSKNDIHQDHRAVFNAALVAVRLVDEVYIYQAPSTTLEFYPNVYFDITDYIVLKEKAVKIHASQWSKVYMAERFIKGLAEYRAFDIFRNDRYMEAFEVFRIVHS